MATAQTDDAGKPDERRTARRVDLRRDAPDAYRALAALTRASTLDHGLAELVKVRASQINGCAYCVDLHVGLALKAGERQRRLHALAVWHDSPFFTERERAALALTEALTLMSQGPVPEERLARTRPGTSRVPSSASSSW